MSQNVRVRFAPSPTGPLHIGGVRTALYNYLFAKKHNGTFILRIEDTDKNRYVEGAENYIINALNWCGIPFDEGPEKNENCGPYRQSERQSIYRDYALKLIETKKAYYAFDSTTELNNLRKEEEKKGETFVYNWRNRTSLNNSLSLTPDEVANKIANGEDYVIRFYSPSNETLELKDLVRGVITIQSANLDDKILFKSDGMPTYHLANVVDDHLMNITHVIRGEEWLPSLALHHLLYGAFDWDTPKFAHLPLILKPTGKGKLSKRDGDKFGFPVFPLEWIDPHTHNSSRGYREDGYFAESMINFLALLGWNSGSEQEIFTLSELVNSFDLERVHKSGARFDPEKIKWFNHHYMQKQSTQHLGVLFKNSQDELSEVSNQYIEAVVDLIKERATFVTDFWELSSFFFVNPDTYDAKALKKTLKEDTFDLMRSLLIVLNTTDAGSKKAIEQSVKDWILSKNIGFGRIMMPLRLALVGALKGPDVFDIIYMIGLDKTIHRINKFITKSNT